MKTKTQKKVKEECIKMQSLWYQAEVNMIHLICHQREGDMIPLLERPDMTLQTYPLPEEVAMILQTYPLPEEVAMILQTYPLPEEVVMILQTCRLQGNSPENQGKRKVKVSNEKSLLY